MTTPDEQRAILNDLNLLATQDIDQFWRGASLLKMDSAEFRSTMIDGVPEIIDPYAASAGDLAAGWYEEAAPELTFRAVPAALAPTEQLAASTSWALYATGEAALTRIAGFTSRNIFDSARRTTVENAEKEPGATWARHASSGACAFCRMLATRGAVYGSESGATRVAGRKGGNRGPQSAGDRYHDHCRCTAVSVRPGQVYEPPDYAAVWEQQYTAAVQATSNGGPINVNAVLAKMDELEHGPNRAAAAKVASKNVNDTAAWLAAESKYNDDVRDWLAAEDAYRTSAAPRTLTESDGRAMGTVTWRDYAESVADTDRVAVRTYTGDTYEPINEYLRGLTDSISGEHMDAVRRIDRVIGQAPRVPENIAVSRAVGANVYGLDAGASPSSMVGRTFVDDGYMSTALQSELKSLNRDEIELRLDVPLGTRGLYVSSHSKSDAKSLAVYGKVENELLLGRGISYEITGATEVNGRRILLARVIEQQEREQ